MTKFTVCNYLDGRLLAPHTKFPQLGTLPSQGRIPRERQVFISVSPSKKIRLIGSKNHLIGRIATRRYRRIRTLLRPRQNLLSREATIAHRAVANSTRRAISMFR